MRALARDEKLEKPMIAHRRHAQSVQRRTGCVAISFGERGEFVGGEHSSTIPENLTGIKPENCIVAENYPLAKNLRMKKWSVKQIQARVERRAVSHFGRAISGLLSDAGYAEDLVRNGPSIAYRLDTLEKFAEVLDWSLGQVLGIEDPDKAPTEIDPAKLRTALLLADRAIGRHPIPEGRDRLEVIASIASEAYDAVSELSRETGSSPSDESLEVLEVLLRKSLRQLLARDDNSKS